MTFVNPKDPSGNPIFAMICPSHQVIFLMMFLKKIIACILINFILIAIFLFQAEKYDSCIVRFKTDWFKETDIGGKTVWVGNY